jgi:hypothetical protein
VAVDDGGALGGVVGGQGDAVARDAAQDGVDDRVSGAGLGELDGVGDRGVGGHAVEVEELEEPELERGADARL